MYPTFTRDHWEDIEDYEDSVLSGRRPACKWERFAIERQLRDMERSESDSDFPYRFDPMRAIAPIQFIECFPHVKGKWANAKSLTARLIALSNWQKWFIAVAFGWVHKETGLRRFSLIELFVPRKNGKSTLAAGLGLYMTVADNEYGAEVYCGATTQKQALEVFRPAKKMAQMQMYFRRQYGVDVHAQKIERAVDGSRFESLIGKPGDGASPSFWICDEYHEHDTDEFVDTMQTGQGARDQGLGFIITTAGTNSMGPCHQAQKELEQVLSGVREDDSVFGIIYTIDNPDEWDSETALEMANPNFGVSVNYDYLVKRQKAAKASPRKQNIFKIKHLNIWVTAREAWLNSIDISRAAESFDRSEFYGCKIGCGIDLSESDDLTGLVGCAEKVIDGVTHYYIFGNYYATEAKIAEIELYQEWESAGELLSCEGNMIDYEQVEDDIGVFNELFIVEDIYNDPACGASVLAQKAQNEYGIGAVKFSQNYTNFSPIMHDFESLLKDGRIHHDGNRCFMWMLQNVIAKETMDGKYIRPVKGQKDAKIDGAVAALMAFAAIYVPNPDDGSDQTMVDLNDD